MKFLLDVGITPKLGVLLEADGHEFRYVPDFYSNKISDADILEIARQHHEVVITHDLDFGTQLAFSAQLMPSVILFRIHHIDETRFYQLITTHWLVIEAPLKNGAFVVIESNAIRIRDLPI
jgi:predicted nuclease of predicted toxin-antitoxin system